MKTIKVKHWEDVPKHYTGIIEWENGDELWLKNGKWHREDGPAVIWKNGKKSWWLNGYRIWYSNQNKLDLNEYIVLLKEPHLGYSTCQVLKYIDQNGIQEQIIIPGMEEWIIE
mgnify:CR=1 FL=1